MEHDAEGCLADGWQMLEISISSQCGTEPSLPGGSGRQGGKEAGRQGEKEAISLNKFKLQLEPDETAVRSLRGFFGDA